MILAFFEQVDVGIADWIISFSAENLKFEVI